MSEIPQPKLNLKEIQFSTTLSLTGQGQKVLHLGDMSSYIIGPFKSQQKVTFCQGNLHQDKSSKWKNFQHEGCRGHLELSKKSKIASI